MAANLRYGSKLKPESKGVRLFLPLCWLEKADGRMRGGIVLFILSFVFFLLLPPYAYPSPVNVPSTPTTVISTEIVGNGTVGPYPLEGGYILQSTETVRKDGLLLDREKDYTLDYNLGLISFSDPLLLQDTLQICYTKLDYNLRRKYYHRELVFTGSDQKSGEHGYYGGVNSPGFSGGFAGKEKGWVGIPQKGSTELSISGSKTFSLELGSAQDVSLKQGLWLQAKGKASQNTEISLQVSDQNLPATQEGVTKKLEELDKVQVMVTSPHFTGTLGDFYLGPAASESFSFQKKLKGVMAEAKAGNNSLSLALASSKGEYFTNRFSGVENRQGPYYLKGKNGESSLLILSGTERVWVDGEEMQRGSDNDYTIDYSRGSIQFTPHRLISADSRIAVDFEYSSESYQRDFYSGNAITSWWDGKVLVKAGGILEKDNGNHPHALDLSDEDKSILSQVGNDRSLATKEGARFAGEGQGSYNLAYDTSGNAYYRYTGADSGSFTVSFSQVGEGKGSYRYRGGGVYDYVYPGNGDFLPVVYLPLPESHSLFDLNLALTPVKSWNTRIEWAGSNRDQNTFSAKDDRHNWGNALSFKSAYDNADFQFLKSGFSRLNLAGEYSFRKKDFVPFGRADIVEKERKWNLPSNSVSADEEIYQFNGQVAPYQSMILDFDYGKLDRKGNFSSQRMSLGTEISPANWISVKAKSERIKSREQLAENSISYGEWRRNMITLNNRVRMFSTALSWEQEKRSSLSSDTADRRNRFDQISGKVGLELSRVIKTSTEYYIREDNGIEEGWTDKSVSRTWRNQFSLQDYRGFLSSDFEFVQRIKKYRNLTGNDSRENLLVTKMDLHPKSQILNVKLYHSQNQLYSAQRVDSYIEVEEGKGNYRYEDGEYFPDTEGNYIRQSEWVGEAQSSLDLSKSLRVVFSPYKAAGLKENKSIWSQAARIFSTDTFINLRGLFTAGKGLGFYFLYPLTRLSDHSILSQNVDLRQDLYFLPESRRINFQLRWENNQNLDGLLSSGNRKDRETKQELYIRSCLSLEYSLESRIGKERIENDWGGAPKYSIEGQSVKVGLTHTKSPSLEIKISGEYKKRREKLQAMRAGFITLSPEFLWSFVSLGRLKAEFQLNHINSSPRGKSLPYILADGKERGENYDWSLSFDCKINQYLTSTMSYFGQSVPGEKIKHNGRMELKAYF
jgi:hypothetical protein